MTRFRLIWYISAIAAVLVISAAYLATMYLRNASINEFKREYEQSDLAGRQVVAANYLKFFSASDLLSAIEEQNVGRLCHVQGHAMGRAVYAQSKNLAESVRQCGNACTFGCFHGALMEMFLTESDTLGGVIEDESPENLIAHVKRMAPDLCDTPEVASAVPYRFCTHGIGHIFAFAAGKDLDTAVANCRVMKTRPALDACVSGVFMEHMFDPRYVADAESKTEAPCDRYPEFTAQCLLYKAYGWIRVWGGVEPALAACDSIGTSALICIRTVGEATSTAKLRSTKEGFRAICGSLSGDKFNACVRGTLLKIVDVNDGDSDHLCDAVAPEYREACLRVTGDYLTYNAKDVEPAP
ncbi:MAG: hypothetical protein KBD06_03915 [Candidatus Pacebacteria bacterium]|nr:hypothetical protein [Candidatus Paceibacterota bacterium]